MTDGVKYKISIDTAEFEAGLKKAVSSLTGMGAKLAAFAGIGGGLAGLAAGVMGQISKGDDLYKMSKSLNETVGNLYQLQAAFKAVTDSSDSVPMFLERMQRALGGVNEMGEPTGEIFSQIGLSMDTLKKSGSVAALQSIFKALSGLNQESAMFAATKLFGRGAGQEAMLLSRSMEEFNAAIKRSAASAAIMERDAKLFSEIEETIKEIKAKGNGLFLRIADGAAPAIQGVLDQINEIDLKGLGQELGRAIAIPMQALSSGEFGKLFSLNLEVAWGRFNGLVVATFASVGEIVSQSLASVNLWKIVGGAYAQGTKNNVNVLGGIGSKAVQTVSFLSSVIEEAGTGKPAPDYKKDKDALFGPFYKPIKSDASWNMISEGLKGAPEDIKRIFETAKNKFSSLKGSFENKTAEAELMALQSKLEYEANALRTSPEPQKKDGKSIPTESKPGHLKSQDTNDWEKMGLVIGGTSLVAEYARRTADNTAMMVRILREAPTNPLALHLYND